VEGSGTGGFITSLEANDASGGAASVLGVVIAGMFAGEGLGGKEFNRAAATATAVTGYGGNPRYSRDTG
jgi:hypothetical protein